MAENGFVQVEQTYNVLIPMKWVKMLYLLQGLELTLQPTKIF